MIPRIRTKIGQIETSEDERLPAGKWIVDLYITELGGGDDLQPFRRYGPFDSEADAKVYSRRVAEAACRTIEEAVAGKSSGQYIDMKDNRTKAWPKGIEV
jgi:hypothetical protein